MLTKVQETMALEEKAAKVFKTTEDGCCDIHNNCNVVPLHYLTFNYV